MKVSKYVLSTKFDNNTYLMISLSHKDLLVIDKNEYENITKILKNNCFDLNDQIVLNLLESGIIVEDDENEIAFIKKNMAKAKFNGDKLNLTIIPTLKCNIGCRYCYQRGVDYDKYNMDEESLNNLISYMKKMMKLYKTINIDWYGGEPLLATEFINRFNKSIYNDINNFDCEINQSISSNLSIINDSIVDFLLANNIMLVSTTIAGLEETHNKYRGFKKYNSFEATIKNMKIISQKIKIMVSINVLKDNVNELTNILDYFNTIFDQTKNNLYFSFSLVKSYSNNECKNLEIDDNYYQQSIIKALNYGMDIGLNMCDMSCFESDLHCGNYHNHSLLIDPGLNVYKCTDILMPNKSIGRICDGDLKISNLSKEKVKIREECLNCKILPYCLGGCIEEYNRTGNGCPSEKEFLLEYLMLYYRKLLREEE